MTDDRSQMMFDILLGIQGDVGQIKRERTSLGIRLVSLEKQVRALLGDLQLAVEAA